MSKVDNTPVREAFLASDLTLSEVCRRLGWVEPRGKPETSRLARRLGLKAGGATTKKGKQYGPFVSKVISDHLAAEILEALGLDPVDVGL